MLDHTDDAMTQQQKMIKAVNTIEALTQELIGLGRVLNDAKGKYAEVKAKIKLEKEKINALKITIRAEAQGYNG